MSNIVGDGRRRYPTNIENLDNLDNLQNQTTTPPHQPPRNRHPEPHTPTHPTVGDSNARSCCARSPSRCYPAIQDSTYAITPLVGSISIRPPTPPVARLLPGGTLATTLVLVDTAPPGVDATASGVPRRHACVALRSQCMRMRYARIENRSGRRAPATPKRGAVCTDRSAAPPWTPVLHSDHARAHLGYTSSSLWVETTFLWSKSPGAATVLAMDDAQNAVVTPATLRAAVKFPQGSVRATLTVEDHDPRVPPWLMRALALFAKWFGGFVAAKFLDFVWHLRMIRRRPASVTR